MADKSKVQNLKKTISLLSNEFVTNKLVYEVNFWFGCSESVKIRDVELNQNPEYDFFGWNNGIGEADLIELEKEGFLVKKSETIDENDPLEKTIEYEIIKTP